MKQRILIIDDEADIVAFVRDALIDDGYDVDTANDGLHTFECLRPEPDLIILDVMMPGLDGWEVCKAIRDQVSCPIIFLSARRSAEDRIRGLMAGGDDYIVKPFSIAELKARVWAHLRREQRKGAGPTRAVIRTGDLSLDATKYQVHIRNHEVPLTPREFEIVQFLAMHPGQVFSRDHIYEEVWGLEAGGDSATVTEHIKRIRSKLADIEPTKTYIRTVWGVGYKWQHSPA